MLPKDLEVYLLILGADWFLLEVFGDLENYENSYVPMQLTTIGFCTNSFIRFNVIVQLVVMSENLY